MNKFEMLLREHETKRRIKRAIAKRISAGWPEKGHCNGVPSIKLRRLMSCAGKQD